jgi:hypothetical protein
LLAEDDVDSFQKAIEKRCAYYNELLPLMEFRASARAQATSDNLDDDDDNDSSSGGDESTEDESEPTGGDTEVEDNTESVVVPSKPGNRRPVEITGLVLETPKENSISRNMMVTDQAVDGPNQYKKTKYSIKYRFL